VESVTFRSRVYTAALASLEPDSAGASSSVKARVYDNRDSR